MTSQPPLLDGTGASLPGPQFVPRPGWGGRLQRWLTHNAYIAVFRLVIVVALVLLGRSLWIGGDGQNTSLISNPTTSPRPLTGFTIKAYPGDGMTNLAARAIDLYVAVQTKLIRLDAAQHLYAVDTLARTTCWCPLKVNQSVPFTNADISSAVDAALKLTLTQHTAWSRLLK